MNKLQQKLTAEIAKQEAKAPASHKVEGYRQTESARALLQVARGRQNWAKRWRQMAIDSNADSVRYVQATMRNFSTKVAIFSKDGVDVLMLAPSRENWHKVRDADLAKYGPTGEEYLRNQYFRVYAK
jgi:bifunctional pyridoxal-dependent enzyme with beta-cystathionase and maltose regulon repressor activities